MLVLTCRFLTQPWSSKDGHLDGILLNSHPAFATCFVSMDLPTNHSQKHIQQRRGRQSAAVTSRKGHCQRPEGTAARLARQTNTNTLAHCCTDANRSLRARGSKSSKHHLSMMVTNQKPTVRFRKLLQTIVQLVFDVI